MNASKYKFDIHMIQKFLNDDLNEYKKLPNVVSKYYENERKK